MISSNLPFSKWERIFKDPMTTAAAIDRLVHHSVILELNLEMRSEKRTKVRAQKRATVGQNIAPTMGAVYLLFPPAIPFISCDLYSHPPPRCGNCG